VRRPIQILLLALAAKATAGAVAGPAAAKTPCWQTLIDDWYDGRIDSVYPVACYREALAHMPEDVAQYSSLEDDINRALAAVIAAGKNDGGSGTTGGDPTNPGNTNSSGNRCTHQRPTTSGSSASTFRAFKADRKGAVVVASGGREANVARGQRSSLGPDNPDSVPCRSSCAVRCPCCSSRSARPGSSRAGERHRAPYVPAPTNSLLNSRSLQEFPALRGPARGPSWRLR
jgi:hypothetical protein